MSYADGTGRDHLRPKAPPGGPLARWHKPPLVLEIQNRQIPHGFARTVFVQPKHAKKALRSFFRFAREPRKQRSKRAYTRRADGQSIIDMRCRAHIQIQTHMPSKRYDRRSVRTVPTQDGCRPYDFCFRRSSGMVFRNL